MLKDIKPNLSHITSVLSPLSQDKNGRFSRKSRAVKKDKLSSNLLDTLFVIVHITLLLSIDLIMYAGSGNVEIFGESVFPCGEVSIIMGIFLLFSVLIVGIFHKFKTIKALIAAIFSYLVVIILYNQFFQLADSINIGLASISESKIVGLVFASLTFVIYYKANRLVKLLFALSVIVLFFNVYFAYMKNNGPHGFAETANLQRFSNEAPRRFIYLMFPNLVSPYYLKNFNTKEAIKTEQLITGFYQKNKFMQYSQAYLKDNNYLNNMVFLFNPNLEKISDNLLDIRLLFSYWKFYNIHKERINLKDNELYNIFHNNHYSVSAYKSRDFDMCRKNNKLSVERCVEKINKPTSIYEVSTLSKTNILFVEWFYSLKLCNNLLPIYATLNKFFNVDKMPLISVTYDNLYVVDSIKVFDVLFSDIKKDTGKQAYFAFVDMPSDMYIYDQYCKILPKNQWIDFKNQPWIKKDYTQERKHGYLQQTRCLYGVMQQFLEKMEKNNLLQDSIIVMQGLSSVNDFERLIPQDFVTNFTKNRFTSMAVYDKRMKNHTVNSTLCSTGNILYEYLFNKKRCSASALNVHESVYADLVKKADEMTSVNGKNYSTDFKNWYKVWQTKNQENLKATKGTQVLKNTDKSPLNSFIVPEY